jgi:flagellar biosynthesis anti-sigma factor FlgM
MPMTYMKFQGEVGMTNDANNNKKEVGRNSDKTKATNRRENGKMIYLQLNLERLTVSKQREFIRIRQMVNNLPELRMDRISRLKKAIDEGTYHVSSKKIAEAIIQKNSQSRTC